MLFQNRFILFIRAYIYIARCQMTSAESLGEPQYFVCNEEVVNVVSFDLFNSSDNN